MGAILLVIASKAKQSTGLESLMILGFVDCRLPRSHVVLARNDPSPTPSARERDYFATANFGGATLVALMYRLKYAILVYVRLKPHLQFVKTINLAQSYSCVRFFAMTK